MKIYANGFATSHAISFELFQQTKSLSFSESLTALFCVFDRMWIVCRGKLHEKWVQILKKNLLFRCTRKTRCFEKKTQERRGSIIWSWTTETFEEFYYKKQDIFKQINVSKAILSFRKKTSHSLHNFLSSDKKMVWHSVRSPSALFSFLRL